MYKTILTIILCSLTLISATPFRQSDECLDYLEQRAEITAHDDVTASAANEEWTTASLSAYYQDAALIRDQLFIMEDVPECAIELHQLTLAVLHAQMDTIYYAQTYVITDDDAYLDLLNENVATVEELSPQIATILDNLGFVPTTTPEPSRLEQSILAIPGVATVRFADVREGFAYWEIDLEPGFHNQQTAEALRQVAFTEAVAMGYTTIGFEFGAILWDGEGPAVDWLFDNETDTWLTTELSITPTD